MAMQRVRTDRPVGYSRRNRGARGGAGLPLDQTGARGGAGSPSTKTGSSRGSWAPPRPRPYAVAGQGRTSTDTPAPRDARQTTGESAARAMLMQPPAAASLSRFPRRPMSRERPRPPSEGSPAPHRSGRSLPSPTPPPGRCSRTYFIGSPCPGPRISFILATASNCSTCGG